jgi:phosphatidylglycerophosphatase A
MSNNRGWREAIPRYEVPPLTGMSGAEKVALFIGTGLGIGFAKPMAPTWGSIPGFLIFVFASRFSPVAAVVMFAALLPVAVWSGTVSERLLGRKDPRPVVIDEIAAVPFALWPVWLHRPIHWESWLVLFAIYRLFDYLKPWPANSLETLKGGLGILMDDVVSSTYMGLALFALIHFKPGWL